MAEVTLELDDALLGAAAHALGTSGAADTVRAALQAVVQGGARPRVPGHTPRLPPLGDPPLDPPERPGRTEFPRPPEIH
jgi:hypothetical protein